MLDELTPPPKKLPQYLGATIVTFGGFCLGTVISWSSPAEKLVIKQLKQPGVKLNWIFSIITLGCALSSIMSGFFMNLIGRKPSIILMSAVLCGGWVIITFSKSLPAYCAGRFITGFAAGSFSVICPTYVAELAHKSIRGRLGVMFQLQIVTGILVGYSLGEARSLWVLNLPLTVTPLLLLLAILTIPESPVYLHYRGRDEKARKSLTFYCGESYPIDEIEMYTRRPVGNFWATFKMKATLKAFGMLMTLHIVQQLSGINAIIFYADRVFATVTPNFPSGPASIMLGVVQLVATTTCAFFVDKFGRRGLWFLSLSVMGMSLVIVGFHFYLGSVKSSMANQTGYVAIAFINLYLVGFSLGTGPLPWLLLGELLPHNMKLLCSIVACTNWLMAFVVTIVFEPLVKCIGAAAIFWIFAGVCAAGVGFVIFCLIETKNKTLDEIQRELIGKHRD